MALLKPQSFVFNGHCSDDFGLIVGFVDSADFKTGLDRDINKSEANANRVVANYYGTKYSDVIVLSFCIFRNTCKGGFEETFTREESRMINTWLTKNKVPALLHFNDESSEYVNYYAICTGVEDVCYNGLNGKKLTFTTNAPYAFSEKYIKTWNIEGEKIIKYNNSSDDGIYLPQIKLIASEDTEEIKIDNITDNKSVVVDTTKYKTIIIDSNKLTVTDENNKLIPLGDLGWGNEYNEYTGFEYLYWLRLLEGINEIKITGSCKFTIIAEFPRKVGVV